MIVAVVGSREFPEARKASVRDRIAMLHIEWHGLGEFKVISGGARGVDTWAREKCAEGRIAYDEYPADWQNLGKRAGYERNETMVLAADLMVAFWDGKSAGTKHTIDLALAHRTTLEVHFP